MKYASSIQHRARLTEPYGRFFHRAISFPIISASLVSKRSLDMNKLEELFSELLAFKIGEVFGFPMAQYKADGGKLGYKNSSRPIKRMKAMKKAFIQYEEA